MLSPSFSISPKEVWRSIGTAEAPQLIDARRREAYDESPHLLPGAHWRDTGEVQAWSGRPRSHTARRCRLQGRA
jgi:hypothetical protein